MKPRSFCIISETDHICFFVEFPESIHIDGTYIWMVCACAREYVKFAESSKSADSCADQVRIIFGPKFRKKGCVVLMY